MVSLGDIARQAGVRPPLPLVGGEVAATGLVAGNLPLIHEPNPIPPPEASPVPPRQLAGIKADGKSAERSSSAVDLYERAIREAEHAQEDSQQAAAPRSSSTPPTATSPSQPPTAQQGFGSHTHPPYAQADHLQLPQQHAGANLSHPGLLHHPQHILEGTAELLAKRGNSPDTLRSSTDPSPVSLASTSIIPEHLDTRRNSQPQLSHASPPSNSMQSPDPSMSGYISSSSSPNYVQQHHHQPMYAYHTHFYAPQYTQPPPGDYSRTAGFPAGLPQSPNMQSQAASSPHFYQPGQAVYYTTPDGGIEHADPASGEMRHPARTQGSSEESERAEAMSRGFVPLSPQQQYVQATWGMHPQSYVSYGGPQAAYMAYDMSQMSSPSMSGAYYGNGPSFEQSSPYYRQAFVPMSPAYSNQPGYSGQHLRYSTAGSDMSSIPYMSSLGQSMGSGFAGGHNRMRSQGQFSAVSQPTELARGHLAQAKFRDAVGALDSNQRLPISQSERRRQSTGEQKLPRPPAHSPWALWAGNIPSDATHAELWQFFASRSPPGPPAPGSEEEQDELESRALYADPQQPPPDYNSQGIESIHLISRSNCCFVNMASKRHLDHAIAVSNGVSLRPYDPRCRTLVCRVRKKDDDNKTGVGAQRGKGMHQNWVKEQEKLGNLPGNAQESVQTAGAAGDGDSIANPSEIAIAAAKASAFTSHSASTTNSVSTSSTTSGFLSRHFPKRYFVVKSHTEEDLHLSVERGLWATQSHNEPVFDQAYRTSESVFLIFGANRSGEFFGYAKMTGPILRQERRISWAMHVAGESSESSNSSNHRSSTSSKQPKEPPIPEEDAGSSREAEDSLRPIDTNVTASPGLPMVSPSGGHLVASSPTPLSNPVTPGSKIGTDYVTSHPGERSTLPVSPSPEKIAAEARKFTSLDPKLLSGVAKIDIDVTESASTRGVADQLAAGSASGTGFVDDDGIIRKDTVLEPEVRNARLEVLEQEQEKAREESGLSKERTLKEAMVEGWGKPFKVEWIRVQKLPFHRTRHLRNSFNGNREVKISRDGTEIEPAVGAQLLELFWKDPALGYSQSPATATAPRFVASPPMSPPITYA